MIRQVRDAALDATAFLTVFPVRRFRPYADRSEGVEVSPWTTLLFPLVGLGLGVALAALRAILPADTILSAALVVTAWTVLTGGLHEDGWADCADAALPPVERARRLEILRDPRVGAHGLVALTLLLIVRFAAVIDVPWWALVTPPIVGRWTMVLSLGLSRPLRSTGLAASMAPEARPWGATASAVGALALVVAGSTGSSLPIVTLVGVLSGLACAMVVGLFLHMRLGGLSGDGHGAVGLAAETGALGAAALLLAGGIQ